MKKICLSIGLISILFTQADQLLRKSDATRSIDGDHKIIVQMDVYKKDKLKSSEEMTVYNKGDNKSLVKLDSRKGELVLSVDENMWIYFPRTRKPMRITPMQRLMGEANNGDIARLNYERQYTAKVLREESYKNEICYVLELNAKSKASTYRKIHYWISKANSIPRKADYFMISGKHFKSAEFLEYEFVNSIPRIRTMKFYKVGQETSYTLMHFLKFEKKSLANKYYNKNNLRNIRL